MLSNVNPSGWLSPVIDVPVCGVPVSDDARYSTTEPAPAALTHKLPALSNATPIGLLSPVMLVPDCGVLLSDDPRYSATEPELSSVAHRLPGCAAYATDTLAVWPALTVTSKCPTAGEELQASSTTTDN